MQCPESTNKTPGNNNKLKKKRGVQWGYIKYNNKKNIGIVNMYFIDLFAGCGGLSLGLMNAGWQGLFAIEKSDDAFLTLNKNLITNEFLPELGLKAFDWPNWLEKKPQTTRELLDNHSTELKKLRGKVGLIAGGPPCQGFSFAGKRNPDDPRNRLTEEYISVVKLVQPKILVLENVRGFKTAFKNTETSNHKPYAEVVKTELEKIGYTVFHEMLNSSLFGVPQPRARFIMIAIRSSEEDIASPLAELVANASSYRKSKGLSANNITTVAEAISDLETSNTKLMPSVDTNGFLEISSLKKPSSNYQILMRKKSTQRPNSLRLAKHKEPTLIRFSIILNKPEKYVKGKSLNRAQLMELGTRKQCFTPLAPDQLSRTITTLPDDLLHYSEPRILTVRENARIQSFPDWFQFFGKYTTGGARRKIECPRYTQVGNAVPPLMAEAIGNVTYSLAKD